MINNWTVTVATTNGSGSQSANNILVRSLFRMGIPVGGKNLFPSNIQGLPTWFTIRVHPDGFVGRKQFADFFVAMNANTAQEDLTKVRAGGFFFHTDEIPSATINRSDVQAVAIPFRKIVQEASSSIRMKKVLANIAYVGVLAQLLGMDRDVIVKVIFDQFQGRTEILEPNVKALDLGMTYAKENLSHLQFPFKAQTLPGGNSGKLLIDGNSASALGLVYGGCTFMSWYPITPSSSIAENFEAYAKNLRGHSGDEHAVGVIQAEDELSAINMVLGAGWAGARAITATSGPGLSLMAEAAGLSYFAEVPAVIWDVQRAGPSTGLPTRTMQGDVSFAQKLSHGDTEHVLLFPANPKECFEFGKVAFDLSEQLQTLVIVLSDLDLGMNFWVSDTFQAATAPLHRGKVLSAQDLETRNHFHRYEDVDGDGVPFRTLPGTPNTKAGYFSRGTGHNEKAGYSEDPQVFANLLTRLKKKLDTAKKLIPGPAIEINSKAKVGIIAYGSTDLIMNEVRTLLAADGIETSYLRLRAWPATDAVHEFMAKHDRVYVVEQNRDGQMYGMLLSAWEKPPCNLKSVVNFDGLPISPQETFEKITALERGSQ